MNLPCLLSKRRRQETAGRARMRDLSVAICCLARDAEEGLKRNIPAIDPLRTLFKSSRVIVVENDSKDRTKALLAEWAKKDAGVTLLSKDTGTHTTPATATPGVLPQYSEHRIGKMAGFRNQYLDEIDKGNPPDILIAIDIDVHGFSIDGICHSFGAAQPWDAILANGKDRDVFYDTYALREFGDHGPKQLATIHRNQIRWSSLKPGAPLVPVACAFGGLGIYRYPALQGLRYRAIPNTEPDNPVGFQTEHEAIHQGMAERGFDHFFINPALTVTYNPFWETPEKQQWFDWVVLNESQHEPWPMRCAFFCKNLFRYGPSRTLANFAITHLLLAPASLEDKIGRRKVKAAAVICALLALAGAFAALKNQNPALAVVAGLVAVLIIYPSVILLIRTLIRLTLKPQTATPAPASP